MNILFLGGDRRYFYMMKELAKKHKVSQIGFDNIEDVNEEKLQTLDLSSFDIIIFPINGINDKQEIKTENGLLYIPDSIFSKINKKTRFFTGLKTERLLKLIPEKQIISFLEFEEVQNVNNDLTVSRNY